MSDTPCVANDHVDWHADNARERALAAELCRGCPIQLECAEQAIDRREQWGVWGGFDFEDIFWHQPERERRQAEGATPRTRAHCGTPGGRKRHYRAGEKPCRACADAHNAYRRERREVA